MNNLTDETRADAPRTTITARTEAILTARHRKDQLEGDGAVGCFDAAAAVAELHAAGFLAPDLPEANDPDMLHPTTKGWLLDAQDRPVVWTAPGGRVMIQRVEPGDLTPAQARTFALNILAAAAYSEGTHHA